MLFELLLALLIAILGFALFYYLQTRANQRADNARWRKLWPTEHDD